jgi:hypothetical protein
MTMGYCDETMQADSSVKWKKVVSHEVQVEGSMEVSKWSRRSCPCVVVVGN